LRPAFTHLCITESNAFVIQATKNTPNYWSVLLGGEKQHPRQLCRSAKLVKTIQVGSLGKPWQVFLNESLQILSSQLSTVLHQRTYFILLVRKNKNPRSFLWIYAKLFTQRDFLITVNASNLSHKIEICVNLKKSIK